MNRLTHCPIAALLCLVLAAVSATAQPVLTRHPENKKVDAAFLSGGTCLGVHGDAYCVLGADSKGHAQVALLGAGLETLSAVPLSKSDKQTDLLTATLADGCVRLVQAERKDKEHAALYATKVALDAANEDGAAKTVLVDTFAYTRKDKCYHWAATSSNGRYQAVATVVEHKEKKEYEARVRLLNAEMQTVWVKNYPLKVVDEICVTDKGVVVALGHEREDNEEHFVISVLSSRREETYDAIVDCFPVRDLRIAGVSGSHVMAMGTYSLDPGELKKNLCGGVVAMSFDIDSAFMTGFSLRPFQNEDFCILFNRRTNRKSYEFSADYVGPLGSTLTDFGAAMLFGRSYKTTESEDNGTETDTYTGVGMHLVAIDTTGQIAYTVNLRRNDRQEGSDDLIATPLLSHRGNVYLLKSEHKKSPKTYDISKESKRFEPGGKSNLVLYTVGAGGEVEKTVVEQKTPHSLVGAVMPADDTIVVLTADGRRMRLSELRLR